MNLSRRDFIKTTSLGTLGALMIKPAQALAQQNWFTQINRVKDPHTLSGKEKGHVPLIVVPQGIQPNQAFEVKIRVGRTLHEMRVGHYIMAIEMFVDEVRVSRTEFTPHAPQATVTIPCKVDKKSTLRVLATCNLHGIWESKTTVL